jgi:dTDP-4-dehydrorhamnose reductase
MEATDDRTILLLGATGQIGHELHEPLTALGAVRAPGRDEVDLTAPDTIRQTVRTVAPDIVVNAAAYTAVDEAEAEPERAAAINAQAPRILVEEAARVDALLVHYSTDYVFDGTKTEPYLEADPPNPLNVYGRTKWHGEQAVQEAEARSLILRTSWVYSHRRSNFLRSMLHLADEHERLTVVDDQIGTPTWAGWIAGATISILEREANRDSRRARNDLYHLASGGQTSWYGFARAIFAQFGRDDVTVEPIPSDEYPTEAPRPAYTVLNSDAARQAFNLEIPTWGEQLDALRARMSAGD